LEFTLQRVRRPHKLKFELQRPDDVAPDGAFAVSGWTNYKDASPTGFATVAFASLRRSLGQAVAITRIRPRFPVPTGTLEISPAQRAWCIVPKQNPSCRRRAVAALWRAAEAERDGGIHRSFSGVPPGRTRFFAPTGDVVPG